MLKYSEEEVRDHIRRYGIGRASEDVKNFAKDMVAKEYLSTVKVRSPKFEMPTGDILCVYYNRLSDTLDIGTVVNVNLRKGTALPMTMTKTLPTTCKMSGRLWKQCPNISTEAMLPAKGKSSNRPHGCG